MGKSTRHHFIPQRIRLSIIWLTRDFRLRLPIHVEF
jgi:hypothetical protein